VRLNLSSVGVTLGGLLVFVGIAFVLTESRSLPYDNLAVALLLNERFGGIFSIRSMVALAFFASAAMIFAWTRLGRDIIAIGSDRRAAMTTGVKVDVLIIGIFAFSGLCVGVTGGTVGCHRAGCGGRDPRRHLAGRRHRAAARHRGRRANARGAPLRAQCCGRAPLRQRHRYGRRAADGGGSGWSRPGAPADRGAAIGTPLAGGLTRDVWSRRALQEKKR
jgi:type IV secretory pathway TrbD component